MATQTRTASKDALMGTQIGGSFNGWNGKDNHLIVGATSNYKWRSVVYFNVDFSPMLSITSAKLYLYSARAGTLHTYQTSAPSTLKVARVTRDWGEGGVDPGEGNLTSTLDWTWDNRHDKFTNTGSNTKNITQGSDESEEWIDVTDIVTAWFNGSNNYGIMLINDSSETNDAKGMQFYSDDKGGALRPKLVIEYATNTPPNAPNLTSPIGASVVNSLTPTLSGTRSDPDSNDYITAAQIQVAEPANVFKMKFETSTTAGNPAAGHYRLNNANSASATSMYISETDADGNDISSKITTALLAGKYLRVTTESGGYQTFAVSSVTDNGSYRTLAISSSVLVAAPTTASQVVIMESSTALAYDDNFNMWDSGEIIIDGSPTTFSVVYGSLLAGSSEAVPMVGNRYYRWRAKTRDKANEWSTAWSESAYFKTNTAPNSPTVTLVSTPSTAVPDDTPDFTITHSDNDANDTKMYAYQFQIDKQVATDSWDTEWDSGISDTSSSPVTTTTVTAASLADIVSGDSKWGGYFRYRARTQDKNSAWSPWSAYQYMTLKSTGVPINLEPTLNSSTSLTPTFSGDRASTDDTIVAFTLEVMTDDLVTTMLSATRYTTGIGTGGASFSKAYAGSALSSGSGYAWRVKVEGATGGVSDWSEWQYFTPADATVPTVISPTGTGFTLTPTITYDRVSTFDAIQYSIYPATSTNTNLGTAVYSSGTITANISAGGLGTRYSAAYGGSPALVYATTYKIRARVSSDGGSNWSEWSGLTTFTTDSAGQPTFESIGGVTVSGGTTWITDTTPDFVIDGYDTEVIDYGQVQVYNELRTGNPLWDSGMIDVTEAAGVATIPWSGSSSLTPGTTYSARAMYIKDTGPSGAYSSWYNFRVNGPPNSPNNIYPTNGLTLADTLLPEFKATFSDPDTGVMSDSPSGWYIVVEEWDGADWNVVYNKSLLSGLLTGENAYQWDAGDYTFVYDTRYRFRTSFSDQKLAAGPYSGYNEFTMSTAPNGTISTPTSGSTINTVRPTIDWSLPSGTQLYFTIRIVETDSSGVVLDGGFKATLGPIFSPTLSYQIPNSGYFKDGKYYNITLTVTNTAELTDPSPSTVNVYVELDAPDAIQGLSPDTSSDSYIELDWDTHTLDTAAGHQFVAYKIYKRVKGDVQWTHVDNVLTRTESYYRDYYAGNGIEYDYKVNVAVNKGGAGVELESPDSDGESIVYGVKLDIDRWMFIGYDRAAEHIQELEVIDENHNAVIQQEQFETLGSDRKLVIRGFVLGVEGSITCVWRNEEVVSPSDPQVTYNSTLIGRRLLAYFITNRGPHILKSPFGDVWEVQFEGPEYRWLPGGHLEVTVNYIETGRTRDVEI